LVDFDADTLKGKRQSKGGRVVYGLSDTRLPIVKWRLSQERTELDLVQTRRAAYATLIQLWRDFGGMGDSDKEFSVPNKRVAPLVAGTADSAHHDLAILMSSFSRVAERPLFITSIFKVTNA